MTRPGLLRPALGAKQGMQGFKLKADEAESLRDSRQPGVAERRRVAIGVDDIQQQLQQVLQQRRMMATATLERINGGLDSETGLFAFGKTIHRGAALNGVQMQMIHDGSSRCDVPFRNPAIRFGDMAHQLEDRRAKGALSGFLTARFPVRRWLSVLIDGVTDRRAH